MNKQVLTLGIVLSFATACSGLSVQTGPTLTSHMVEEQGLGSLWSETTDPAPVGVMRADVRNDTKLADLWVKADNGSNRNGDSPDEAPRATALLDKLTLTHSVFGSDSNRSQVLPK